MNGENRKEFREILVIAFLSLQVLVSITLIFRVRNLEQAFVSYTEAAVDESESESYDFVEGVVPGDGYSVGPDNAPITIVEFSDFQCPYCASSVAMWRAVLEKYPGQTRLIYRHFPLPSHSRATEAALAAECAGEQGYFWEMHDKLFANRDTLNELAFETLARELVPQLSKNEG